ncbi:MULTISPECIES: deoxyguanosinetriphosphate triphosphohydrolase family protein [unclassified Halorubrum]|uniref:deoxyguanosinetriphosphate triphosphohydrolase family protein n=1 Tax=unclassified Halorubrum TaxID=2642239 RepID=UPI0018EE863F|nr:MULTISPECIES: dNTP triphosphohydrolase [unclassified Halorubrum]
MTADFPRDRRPSDLDQDLSSGYDPEKESEKSVDRDTEDQRRPFERDRDRILYSREFRRLKDVTQVARAGESYLYHDRLTHSLKVAQVGRRLAELLEKFYDAEFENLDNYLDPEVVETASLAHDIGHPPFGHEIEELLDDKVREKSGEDGVEENFEDTEGDGRNGEEGETNRDHDSEEQDESKIQGFEGNAQSFRAVTRLGSHRSGIEGIDLTRATLNAIQKYPWSRAADAKTDEDTDDKWGYYPSEEGYFEFARAGTADGRNKILEAEIMDYADDLTYAIHDVEDFYRSGLLPFDQLLREAGELRNQLPDDFGEDDDIGQHTELLRSYAKSYDMKLHDFGQYINDDTNVEASIEDVLSFFVELRDFATVVEEFYTPYEGTQSERNLLNEFSSSMISWYLEATEDDPGDREYVELGEHDEDGNPTLLVDNDLRQEIEILKQLTFYYVISNPTLRGQQKGQIQVIDELFELLYDEAAPKSVDTSAILEPYRERLNDTDEDDDTARARIVADMISNMTETQAIEMYERMSGARPGSLQDTIMRQ